MKGRHLAFPSRPTVARYCYRVFVQEFHDFIHNDNLQTVAVVIGEVFAFRF